jgi:hypothetical protein
MERHKDVDPAMAAVLSAIKATVKGGIGKLFENPQGKGYKDGEPWPAMMRPTWRPDIRAAVISKARVNMHRKMLKMAEFTGLYPLAVLSDCVVYPAPSPSPLDFLPYAESGKAWPSWRASRRCSGPSTSWRRASTPPATSRAATCRFSSPVSFSQPPCQLEGIYDISMRQLMSCRIERLSHVVSFASFL